MPTFRFTPTETDALARFLQGQSMLHLRPAGYRVEPAAEEDPVARFSCAGCHKWRGRDGGVAPDLDLLYGQRSEEWLKDFLRDPASLRPGARMPEVSDDEAAQALAAVLLKAPAEIGRPESLREQFENLCARCHGAVGDGRGTIAANLTGAPRRLLDNRGYVLLAGRVRLIENLLQGIPGTAMPPFKGLLSRGKAGTLIDFVLLRYAWVYPEQSLTDIEVPSKKISAPHGAETTYSSLCAHCHGEAGDRSSRIVHHKNPQPRDFRNRPYMEARTDEQVFRAISRGIPGTRMKAYGGAVTGSGVRVKAHLSDEQIRQLVEHVRRLGNQ